MNHTKLSTSIPNVNYAAFVENLFRVLPTPAMMFSHAVLGVATEMTEIDLAVSDNNFTEELGDLLFFVTAGLQVLHGLPHNPVTVEAQEHNTLQVFRECAKDADILGLRNPKRSDHTRTLLTPLLDVAKRWMAYDKQPSPNDITQIVSLFNILIVHAASHPAYGFDITSNTEHAAHNIRRVVDVNVAKLKTRYKAGFSTEAAINRDVVVEAEVIQRAVAA
jgi:hypothetical protein